MRTVLYAFAAALLSIAPAVAQSAARQPDWARPLLANDPDAIRLSGSTLSAPRGGLAVRLTVAPAAGGVARVIRYQSDGKTGTISMLRFTGHIRNGWSLWGSETPTKKSMSGPSVAQLDALARRALQQAAYAGESSDAAAACSDGALVFVEASDNTRGLSLERRCSWAGSGGALAQALSDAAGSRDEEELYQAGVAEVLEADRAFAKLVGAVGWAEASKAVASEGASIRGMPGEGVLNWTPAGADVAARGDMAYSWGRWTLTPPAGGQGASGDYLSVWRRDADGVWKYAARQGP